MARISIDLDNTVACYDQVFSDIAAKMNFIAPGIGMTKDEVKRELLGRYEDTTWQKLQGKAYGKYMNLAMIFPGFIEFLYLARIRGHDLDIVSHKTEFGHFDEEKISLREEAKKWLQTKGIVGSGEYAISEDCVYFGETRELKIQRINDIESSVIIDDLPEILEHAGLNADIERIHFNPKDEASGFGAVTACSWRDITRHLLGAWSEQDIRVALNQRFPDLAVERVSRISGSANSEVFRLFGGNSRQYLLKIYPDLQLDRRARLRNEINAIKLLRENGFSVPECIDSDSDLNWAVFEFIEGEPVSATDPQFIENSLEFVSELASRFSFSRFGDQFPPASEACTSGIVLLDQIDSRLKRLEQSDDPDLRQFVDSEFMPAYGSCLSTLTSSQKALFETPLDVDRYVLSPSDFGAHNAIKDAHGKISYIDFEYFGWDDPVKLVCDYLWHPGMDLPLTLRSSWLDEASVLFAGDHSFNRRLVNYLPFFGLKWCLILLNEFLPENLHQKLRTGKYTREYMHSIHATQLMKARNLLANLRTIATDYGSALKRT
jgi:thiamine kinase-like enzyme